MSNVTPINGVSHRGFKLTARDHLYRAKSILQALNAAYTGNEGDGIDEPTYCLEVALDLIQQALEGEGQPT